MIVFPQSMLNIATMVRNALQHTGSILWLLVHTIAEMGDTIARGRMPFRLSIFFQQCDRTGVGSVPLVALVSFFIGLTMALLTGYQLATFGQQRLVPALVAIAFTRELGPLMTGIMLAARIGAAYTAELGTMTVSEEVEAIEAMGLGPLRFLVSPRLLAVVLLMPCLVVISDVTAMAGGALISLWAFDIPFRVFFETGLDNLLLRDLVAGVGDATTSSVVTAITTVIGFDTLFNIVLVALFE
jgi:phospholipid/cholesterol/gamma-HCH transport system permease protein